MRRRQAIELWKLVLTAAAEEARRRGERRLGTDHLLLALLRNDGSPAAIALGVSLADARAALDALDKAALAAVGVKVESLGETALTAFPRRFPPLTSSARAVLKRTANATRRRKGRIDTTDFLVGLLALQRPDPAAELMEALGVHPQGVSERLGERTEGGAA